MSEGHYKIVYIFIVSERKMIHPKKADFKR